MLHRLEGTLRSPLPTVTNTTTQYHENKRFHIHRIDNRDGYSNHRGSRHLKAGFTDLLTPGTMKTKSFPTTLSDAIKADNAAWTAENKVKDLPPPVRPEKRTVMDAPRPTKDYKRRKVENIQLSHIIERAQEKRRQASPTTGFKSRAKRPDNWSSSPTPKPVVPPPPQPAKPLRKWRGASSAFDQIEVVFGQLRVKPLK